MNSRAAHIARPRASGAILPAAFYARETETVARELLGCVLECRTCGGFASGRIVETEAYLGEHDPACHAAVGRTKRTDPLYGPPGTAYVYFIYGSHWCFNAVTRPMGLPSAVLIRSIEPLQGLDLMRQRRPATRRDEDLANGPGKLCAALDVGERHNRLALQGPPLVIREGQGVPDASVVVTPRIGIRVARDWPLRWCEKGSPHLSRTPPHLRQSKPALSRSFD